MKLGQRMIRLEDGMRGVVAQNGPELRILYTDRGEERLASKNEKWVPDEIQRPPLREEEIALVAWHADRALRCYEKNEPLKFWETPDFSASPYDQGLARVIMDYLHERQAPKKSNTSN